MGQTLSSPATDKETQTGENGHYLFSVTAMQGWRISMEDSHAAVLDLDEGKEESNTFFAVYDGHGGATVAKYAGENVHKRLITEESYRNKDYESALKRAFLGTDEDILADPVHTRDGSGCTAVAALLTTDGKIYVANAGDSRSVLSVKGVVKELSFDHKPTNAGERARINDAGGYVEYGRVNGNLSLSRALGDFQFKKNYSLTPEAQIITADPEISCHEITEEDEFLILACDGIWDCLDSQQAVDFVRLQVSEGKELNEIGENICEHCLAPDTTSGAGIGCDNMTVLIVAITHGRTKEEWSSWITSRVKSNYGYNTPNTLPSLYSQSRLISFRARREAEEARLKYLRENPRPIRTPRQETLDLARALEGSGLRLLGSWLMSPDKPLQGFEVVYGNTPGIVDDDDDDDDNDETTDALSDSYLGSSFSPESPDPTKQLREHLTEFEEDLEDDDSIHRGYLQDSDNPSDDEESRESKDSSTLPDGIPLDGSTLQGEAPPPPKTPNDNSHSPPPQLKSEPGGDAPSPVVQVEGLLDKSEDPLRG